MENMGEVITDIIQKIRKDIEDNDECILSLIDQFALTKAATDIQVICEQEGWLADFKSSDSGLKIIKDPKARQIAGIIKRIKAEIEKEGEYILSLDDQIALPDIQTLCIKENWLPEHGYPNSAIRISRLPDEFKYEENPGPGMLPLIVQGNHHRSPIVGKSFENGKEEDVIEFVQIEDVQENG